MTPISAETSPGTGVPGSHGSRVEQEIKRGSQEGVRARETVRQLRQRDSGAAPPEVAAGARAQGVRTARRAARLRPEVAAWYDGLGGGSFTAGLERAYTLLQASPARPSTPPAPSLTHLVERLAPSWRLYSRQAPPDEAARRWVLVRAQGLGVPLKPTDAARLLEALRLTGGTA